MYIVSSNLVAPDGFSDVTFEKNADIPVNNGTGTYNVNKYSGKAYYTLGKGVTYATLQLELAYDIELWNKLGNELLTSESVKPIQIELLNKDENNEYEMIKELAVDKAYSGSAYGLIASNVLYVDDIPMYQGATVKANQDVYYRLSLSEIQQEKGMAYFFDKLEIEVNLPKYIDSNGNSHYIEVTSIENEFLNYGYGIPQYTINYELLETEGKIIIDFENVYLSTYSNGVNLFKIKAKVPEDLQETEEESLIFKDFTIRYNVLNKSNQKKMMTDSYREVALVYKLKEKEKIECSVINFNPTIINIPKDAVEQLGGFYIENSDVGDSEEKNIKIEFDSDNTGKIQVTTIRLPVIQFDKYIKLKYTLVDENNEIVYLDNEGNRVDSQADNAISQFEYTITNSSNSYRLYRGLLPKEQQDYYFKTLEYKISTIPGNTKLFRVSANKAYDSAGNFYGYIKENAVAGEKINSTIEITSANFPTINKTSTATLSATSTTAYGMKTLSINSDNALTITAGSSANLVGTIESLDYPYGNALWLNDIVLALILPEGVSVNAESAFFWTKDSNNKIYAESNTIKNLNNGNYLYKFYLPKEVAIGYSSETINPITTSGKYLNFSLQLDTSTNVSQQTIQFKNSIFVGSLLQENAADGSYSYYSKADTYDINDNGSTTDRIGGLSGGNTCSLEIQPRSATFDIDDAFDTNNKEKEITTSEDTINYKLNLNCADGGEAKDFVYYIPIPKKDSVTDSYLITSTENAFDMNLQESAVVSGNDIYDIYYTTKSGLNYSNVGDEDISWLTKEEIDNDEEIEYHDITMIKILSKNPTIENGSKTTISIKLKYVGTTYYEEAGNSYTWHSAGQYKYIVGDREISGNFSTKGVTATLTYQKTMKDIELTAQTDMKPQEAGNVREYTTLSTELPKFLSDKNFKITNVETYNVTLKSKEYINNNLDMDGVYANETFAITVELNSGAEKDILSEATKEAPIDIGQCTRNTGISFKYKIYNAKSLSDNSQTRYIVVTITGESGVTIKQKININCELAVAQNPESALVAGKRYMLFNDTTTTIDITANSSITAQFVTSYIPNLYTSKELIFSKDIPIGTNIILLDKVDDDNFSYWYYSTKDNTTSQIDLTEFTKMGTTSQKYVGESKNVMTNEIFLVIIDFSQCKTFEENEYSLNLVLRGNNVDDVYSKVLSFNTKKIRTFDLSANTNTTNFGEEVTLKYSISDVDGIESVYSGKKLALVISTTEELPSDTYIEYNNSKYYNNSENKFIIPLDGVQVGEKEMPIKVNSEMLTNISKKYNFTAELWMSATSNSNAPMMGNKLAETVLYVNSLKKAEPALKVIDMSSRVISIQELDNIQYINIQYKDDENCLVKFALQKKVGSGYQIITDKLNMVNDNTVHTEGYYNINAISGNNNITFKLSNTTEVGTYRLILVVEDQSENKLLEVPYNFIIM